MGDCLFADLFDDLIYGSSSSSPPDNPFSILDDPLDKNHTVTNYEDSIFPSSILEEPFLFPSKRSAASSSSQEGDNSNSKKQKLSQTTSVVLGSSCNGQNRMSHINVERNRRKQMNDNLSVLRSLMPCFYVKRGDQASIISGVINYIKELQQVLQSMESKKQRKIYSDVNVLSPRTVVAAASSPRLGFPLSPRLSPLSPRIPALPISPGTPTRGSCPYKPNKLQQLSNLSPRAAIVGPQFECFTPCFDGSGVTSSSSTTTTTNSHDQLLSNSKSAMADVEVKFSGPNVLLKTVSNRIPGQAVKIISVLEGLSLEILHVSISTIGETLINSFTIKIGIECELSAEELAQEIQQTFTSIKNGVSTIVVD